MLKINLALILGKGSVSIQDVTNSDIGVQIVERNVPVDGRLYRYLRGSRFLLLGLVLILLLYIIPHIPPLADTTHGYYHASVKQYLYKGKFDKSGFIWVIFNKMIVCLLLFLGYCWLYFDKRVFAGSFLSHTLGVFVCWAAAVGLVLVCFNHWGWFSSLEYFDYFKWASHEARLRHPTWHRNLFFITPFVVFYCCFVMFVFVYRYLHFAVDRKSYIEYLLLRKRWLTRKELEVLGILRYADFSVSRLRNYVKRVKQEHEGYVGKDGHKDTFSTKMIRRLMDRELNLKRRRF